MAKDFVPIRKNELRTWLTFVKDKVSDLGPQSGLTPAEIAEVNQLCTEYSQQIHDADQARIHAKSQNSKKKQMRKTHEPRLRKLFGKMKITNINKNNAKAMRIMANTQELDEKTFKPILKVTVVGGEIIIRFKKYGLSGFRFKMKIGDMFHGEWTDLGFRMTSPWKYKPKEINHGEVERISFMAQGVKNDQPFGEWSNLVTVVYDSLDKT